MINQKDRILFQLSDREKEFSKPAHHWLAQYDEEDDFLSERPSNALPEFTEEE